MNTSLQQPPWIEVVEGEILTIVDGAEIDLVVDGPLASSTSTIGQFTLPTWPGYARQGVVFAGAHLDALDNPFISAPSNLFTNSGTANVAVIGVVGTNGAPTSAGIVFKYVFDAPVTITPGGQLDIPNKLVFPIVASEVPNPSF